MQKISIIFQRFLPIKWWAVIVSLVGLVIISWGITALAFWRFAVGDFARSHALLQGVYPVSFVVSKASFKTLPLVEVWHESVWLMQTISDWQLTATDDQEPLSIAVLTQQLPTITTHFDSFVDHFQRSVLLSAALPNHDAIAEKLSFSQRYFALTSQMIQANEQWLVLLQNTDEIRATGGFIGSYTVIDFSQPNPFELEIRDIYDPSGISFAVPSPVGHQQYLSDGTGLMKLHDANWNPDFPTTAELMLRFFEQIKQDPQYYDGVVAIPLSMIETLVETVGGVYLADEQQLVTAASLADIIRQDRGDFFPGSREKQQALQAFYAALMIRLSELSLSEWWQLFDQLVAQGFFDQVQLYAVEPATQTAINQLGLSGSTPAYDPQELYLFPVESNVGINKANRKVARRLEVNFVEQQLALTTSFTNDFTLAERPTTPSENSLYQVAPHLSYINYYRLLVRSDMRLRSVLIDGQPLESWDEQIVIGQDGSSYLQVGFLVVVPEESEVVVEAHLFVPAMVEPRLTLQRQIGVEYDEVLFGCGGAAQQIFSSGNYYQGICQEAVE